MQFLGGDADLRAEPELLTVDESGRRVHEHGRRVDLTAEAVGGVEVAGDDRLGVPGAEAGDVIDRGVE